METEMNIQERLLVLNLLPKEGSILTLRVIKDIIKTVGLSDKEIQEWEVKQTETGSVTWNQNKVKLKKIVLGDTAASIITDALKKQNKEEKLAMEYVDIYDKFVKE